MYSLPYHYISAGSANQDSQLVQGRTSYLYLIAAFCTQSSIRYLKIYDKVTAPTSADTPKLTILIPGNSSGAGVVVSPDAPIAFYQGIGFRITTGVADTDTGAAAANDVVANLTYS